MSVANGQPLPVGLMGSRSFLVAMADGSVRNVTLPKVSESTLRQLMDRSDGQGNAGQLD